MAGAYIYNVRRSEKSGNSVPRLHMSIWWGYYMYRKTSINVRNIMSRGRAVRKSLNDLFFWICLGVLMRRGMAFAISSCSQKD